MHVSFAGGGRPLQPTLGNRIGMDRPTNSFFAVTTHGQNKKNKYVLSVLTTQLFITLSLHNIIMNTLVLQTISPENALKNNLSCTELCAIKKQRMYSKSLQQF